MTTPDSLFSFRNGECGVGSYEISTADRVMVLCVNGRKTFFWFQLKTKELSIDGELRGFKKDSTFDYFWEIFGLQTRRRPTVKMQLRSVIDGKIKVRTF